MKMKSIAAAIALVMSGGVASADFTYENQSDQAAWIYYNWTHHTETHWDVTETKTDAGYSESYYEISSGVIYTRTDWAFIEVKHETGDNCPPDTTRSEFVEVAPGETESHTNESDVNTEDYDDYSEDTLEYWGFYPDRPADFDHYYDHSTYKLEGYSTTFTQTLYW